MSDTISMRAFLGTLLLGALSASTAPADDAPTCGGVLGTPEEIAATPRGDINLEHLALFMGSGVTASQELYGRVRAEVALVRSLLPDVADIAFRPRETGQELILGVDVPTLAAIEGGTYDAWDCLNDYYGLESVRVLSRNLRFVVLRLKGLYDTALLAPYYATLPGIESAEPNHFGGDSSTICGLADSSSTHHYFFVEAHGDCLAGCISKDIRYLTTRRTGAFPEFRGRWSNQSDDPRPAWFRLYQQCEHGNNPLPARVDAAPVAPAAGDPVVLTVSGEDGNSACGPFLDGHELDLSTSTIRIAADFNESCGACTADVTPYAFDVDLGGLPAGEYQVSVSSRDGCDGHGELLAMTKLTVRGTETSASRAPGNPAAATLLVPYFEVELVDPEGPTTIFSVANSGSEAVVAHVVLWTDRGLPTLAFDLWLGTDDIQTIDLRAVLAGGELPLTGSTRTGTALGCTTPITLPDLGAEALAELQAKHTGLPSPSDGLCYGSGRAAKGLAVGYVTVDAMNGCSETIVHPSDDGYFEHGGAGLASNRNVLWGDVIYLSSADLSAQGVEAVPIVADASLFADAVGSSFYRLHVGGDGRDNRVPLGHRYRSRFLAGGAAAMSTEVLVWTEGLPGAALPRDCDVPFPQHPPTEIRLVATFHDEKGGAAGVSMIRLDERTRKLAVGAEPLVPETLFGQIDLVTGVNCNVCGSPIQFFPGQTWMTTVLRAAGKFSAAQHATRLEDPNP